MFTMPLNNFLKKHKAKEGDFAEITHNKELFKGTVIPSKEKNMLMLKLTSGYNAGFLVGEIESIKLLGKGKKVGKAKPAKIRAKKGLPKIAILHTGGTIASRVDYRTGAVETSFNAEDLLTMFPELTEIADFESKLISQMWSDDFRFKHFETIAKEVKKYSDKGVDGIILSMGTDNMCPGTAALAFAIEKCPIPIIIVGAQRSSDRGSSDAAMNLICAAEFIAKTDFAGVAICMHHSSEDRKCAILPATKTRKLHTSRRNAFKPVNDSEIAFVDYESHSIEFLKKDYSRKSKEKMQIKPKFEEKTGFIKVHVNMFPEEFEFFSKNKYKGYVIEGTGLGHTPGHVPNKQCEIHKKMFPAIKKFTSKGGIVVMTSQCIFGRVHLHVYDKGIDLMDAGVIPGEDMLAETAFVKLSWLLGNYSKEKSKELIAENLRGEITERTLESEFELE